jgi:hypothetical protein
MANLIPPAKLAGTPVIDDEAVAKMGHPSVVVRSDVGHPYGCETIFLQGFSYWL